jgi:hypothetical protein
MDMFLLNGKEWVNIANFMNRTLGCKVTARIVREHFKRRAETFIRWSEEYDRELIRIVASFEWRPISWQEVGFRMLPHTAVDCKLRYTKLQKLQKEVERKLRRPVSQPTQAIDMEEALESWASDEADTEAST